MPLYCCDMNGPEVQTPSYQALTLAGVRYAVVPEVAFLALCRRAGHDASPIGPVPETAEDLIPTDLTGSTLAQRLVSRREQLGLSQAALARRAGIRVETLNRIERGKTEPDYSTVRKLVTALRTGGEPPASIERKNA